MPRIPVRTEPYTSSTRQHRHFKSKRDLILRTLGKSSYINGSQFVIAWISAKGEVETYASEMLQETVDDILDLELLKQLAIQVREGAERKREQLEEIQRKRREEGGLLDDQGRVMDEWADMEPAEMASHLLRSAKKAKAERVAAENAARTGEEDGSGGPSSLTQKGKEREQEPPLTPLRLLKEDPALVADEDEDDVDQEEEEGEDDYEEEAEDCDQPMEQRADIEEMQPTLASAELDLAEAKAQTDVTEPKREEIEDQGDITLVNDDPSALLATPVESIPTKRKADSSAGQGKANTIAPNVRHVQVTTTGSPLSIRTRASESVKRGMLMTATPSRPTSLFTSNVFVTPSMHEGTQIIAPTPKSGKTSGLMNNVLEGSSGAKNVLLGPSFTVDKPHIPRPLAHVRTPSQANVLANSLMGTPITPSVQTRSITIRQSDLIDWYAERFESLQQTTCKLVVKSWIKVIEPKKQSKFPYNRGEDCRPGWWPEHIRHREPDHLQKPERTQILVSIIRSSLAPISKLELSTAEATAYINQPRMRILRDIYKVAKEDERRRNTGETLSDIVVNVPASPPVKATSISKLSMLDEIEMQMGEASGTQPRRPSNANILPIDHQQKPNLASPCVILPSATISAFSAAGHQKAGSIGESVFLGAGAIKKRKLDELTQSNKENIDPNDAGPAKTAKARKSAKTPNVAASTGNIVVRPQSTGGIRKGKQTGKAGQRHSIANEIHPPALAMSGIVSPMMHPPTARPWSTAGTRTLANGDPSWMTTDTPMNQRQQRMHQIQGEGIIRPMSSDSALSAPSHIAHGAMVNGNNMQPHMMGGMTHSLPHGMLPGSSGLDMYLATDANGQTQILPPNVIPITSSRSSFSMQQDPNQPPGPMQYIPYGVQHGMPPFSSVPHQGTFMVYEPNPTFMRTNSTSSASSMGERRQSHRQSIGNQSQPHLTPAGVGIGTPQGYMYPNMHYAPLGYQPMYIHAETEPNSMHLATQHGFPQESNQMLSYPTGVPHVTDDATHIAHGRKPGKNTRAAGRSTPSSLSAPASRPPTSHASHLGLMSMPLTMSSHANLATAGYDGVAGMAGLDGVHEDTTGAVESQNGQRAKHADAQGMVDGQNHRMMDVAATRPEDTANENGAAPAAMDSTRPGEMTEMETVEREFVKFSDGSDRDNFWTNDSL